MTARDEEVLALLTLEDVPGLGPAGIRTLREAFGSGARALEAARRLSGEHLWVVGEKRLRLTPETIRALRHLDRRSARRAIRRARALGLRAIPLGARDYPDAVTDLGDPPPVLFVEGAGWPDLEHAVAIVGTRRASPYGRRMARRVSRDLARRGWTVISGMAAGIDAAAHEAALDAGGSTVGVLGSGHARDYPSRNRELFARMRERGWLVSEFRPWIGPTRRSFPRRNRLIAALARAVVVVEAGERSGALNTATHALELGREVLAVPHRVDDAGAGGTLRLLRSGAALVAQARDVLDTLGVLESPDDDGAPAVDDGGGGRRLRSGTSTAPGPAGGRDGWLCDLLREDELTPDEITSRTGTHLAAILAALGRLELDGRIARAAGGRFYARDEVGSA